MLLHISSTLPRVSKSLSLILILPSGQIRILWLSKPPKTNTRPLSSTRDQLSWQSSTGKTTLIIALAYRLWVKNRPLLLPILPQPSCCCFLFPKLRFLYFLTKSIDTGWLRVADKSHLSICFAIHAEIFLASVPFSYTSASISFSLDWEGVIVRVWAGKRGWIALRSL